MSLYEVQMRVETFLAVQLTKLRSAKFCLPPPIRLNLVEIQVQKIEFGTNLIRHNVPEDFGVFYRESRLNPDPPHFVGTPIPASGFTTQIAQDISLHLTTMTAIMGSPNAEPPPLTAPIKFTVIFRLDYYPAPMGGCVLNMQFDHIEWGELPSVPGVDVEKLKKTIQDLMAKALASKAVPFDFATMLPKGVTEIANAGVSVDTSLQIIAFRVDPFGGSDRGDIAWTYFYSGNFADRLQGSDWAMFIDGKTLESKFAFEVEQALKSKPQAGLAVSSIGSRYWADGTTPRVDTTIHAFVDVPVLPKQYVAPTIQCAFSVSGKPASLVTDIHLDEIKQLLEALPDFIDMIGEVLPPIGWIIELAAGEALSDMRNKTGELGIEPSGMHCVKVTDVHRRCAKAAEIPALEGVQMIVDALTAFGDGMAITGRILNKLVSQSTLMIDQHNFGWIGPRISCGQASNNLLENVRENPQNYATLYSRTELSANGTRPTSSIYVCSVEVIDDPLGVYPKTQPNVRIESERLPTALIVQMYKPTSLDFQNAPYPMKILLRTTAGVRLVQIEPPPPFTPEAIAFVVGSVRVQLLACPAIPEWFRGGRAKFDLSWIEDPLIDPDRDFVIGHDWEIIVQGADVGQSVTLVNAAGLAVTRTATQRGEALKFTEIVPPSSGVELSLSHTANMATEPDDTIAEVGAGPAVEIRQRALLSAAVIALPQRCRSLLPTDLWSRAGVVAVLENGLVIFDLDNPSMPARIGWWSLPAIRGACVLDDRLLVYGDDGSWIIDAGLRIAAHHSFGNIRDVAVGGAVVHMLSDQGIEVRSARDLQKLGFLALHDASCMLRVDSRLFVGGEFGLVATNVANAYRPELEFTLHGLCVVSIRPVLLGDGAVLAVLADGTARIVEVADCGLQEVATFSAAPLWAGAVRIGDMLTYLSADRMTLGITLLGQQRLAVPSRDTDDTEPYRTEVLSS